jgi:transketolase
VTVEDHSIIGGLGSAVAEVIAERGLRLRLARQGIGDVFPSSGEGESLLDFYGMRAEEIAGAAKAVIGSGSPVSRPVDAPARPGHRLPRGSRRNE